MKPELWAVLTALCWAIGSALEKTGMRSGGFTPVLGVAIRTATSLILLAACSIPFLGELKTSGIKPVLFIMIGGGLFAGFLGVVCLYAGLKSGRIATVMAIAFCLAPVFGTAVGIIFLKEKINLVECIGMAMCIIGAGLIISFK